MHSGLVVNGFFFIIQGFGMVPRWKAVHNFYSHLALAFCSATIILSGLTTIILSG
jgi:hypothetical protein